MKEEDQERGPCFSGAISQYEKGGLAATWEISLAGGKLVVQGCWKTAHLRKEPYRHQQIRLGERSQSPPSPAKILAEGNLGFLEKESQEGTLGLRKPKGWIILSVCCEGADHKAPCLGKKIKRRREKKAWGVARSKKSDRFDFLLEWAAHHGKDSAEPWPGSTKVIAENQRRKETGNNCQNPLILGYTRDFLLRSESPGAGENSFP